MLFVHSEEEWNKRCVNSNDKGGQEECRLADDSVNYHNNDEDNIMNHDYGDMVEWIQKNGGFVDIHQDVCLNDMTNVNSGYGVFAKEDISKGEL